MGDMCVALEDTSNSARGTTRQQILVILLVSTRIGKPIRNEADSFKICLIGQQGWN